MIKIVKEFLFEFEKGLEPKKALNIGISAILKREDEKHDWSWSPSFYSDFNYTYFKPKTYDIVCYYGNYVKIIEFFGNDAKQYGSVSVGTGFVNEPPQMHNNPQKALFEEIVFLRDYFEKDLVISQKNFAIVNRVTIPKQFLDK